MVELFEQDVRKNDRQSSKGNQLKWESAGIWYKADYTGYEGLTEYVVSLCLAESTLNEDEYVLYQPEQIRYKNIKYNGVSSKNFLEKGWQIITLERLYKNMYGRSLTSDIWKIPDCSSRFDYLVDSMEKITGLEQFGVYINKLFTIDMVFLNEDRHFHNIAVLMNEDGRFAYCPIFDNGAGLLSDTTMDYPMGGDIYQLMGSAHSKTISYSFEEQVEVSEKKVGSNIKFRIRRDDICEKISHLEGYSDESCRRVLDILNWQIRNYSYLFEK